MPINIVNQNPSQKIPSGLLRKCLQKISVALDLKNQDINFQFVSDREIRRTNKKYLHHDYATDVLAFEMKEKGVLGDIMISSETARRQACEQKHSYLKELKILAIHGWLHLLGYRDKKKKDAQCMWKKTNELLLLMENLE